MILYFSALSSSDPALSLTFCLNLIYAYELFLYFVMLHGNFVLISSFKFYNFFRSCIKCLFVIYAVFFLSDTPISPPHGLLVRYFSNSLVLKVFLSIRFSLFFQEKNTLNSIQHLIAVLFLSMLFKSSFAKYFLIYVSLPLWKFLLYFLFVRSGFILMPTCI